MARKVEAPDALAEQRGREKVRAVAPIPHQETQRPEIGSALLGARLKVGCPAYPGGDVGPNPTPRTRLVDRRGWNRAGPDQQPRDWAPKS
jgi:hypothetical protein